MNIDEIDLDILRELASNARAPLSAISDKVMLSVPAVSERIKKLEKGGFISKYSAILDPSKFNKNLTCFTFVTLRYDETKLEAFRKFVENEPDINECHLITGEYEYILKITTSGPDSLGNLLDSLRKNADVLTSSTSIVLSSLRQDVSIRV
ncbi:MAG: Lrp/AsnC family transcriptional regulator [Gudongella sp.]|jgi:Lrp/AsnC family leucine-responsive transcriptional regulator|nr:Lrp/AsnC family transcriptional regulator [Gudongella sp.]